ncbi:putative endonuclease lcl3 [Marasmius tenuissimus]|nr:putative endonuclease lcl3 [Marasmius tenuissimus]
MPSVEEIRKQLNDRSSEWKTLSLTTSHYQILLAGVAAGSLITVVGRKVYRRYFWRIKNSDWITPDILGKRRWVKGVVTYVGDGDNFRLYHTPGFGWQWPLKFRRIPLKNKDLLNRTIHIRIAGVDAPECAHFGKPAQPYADESLAWLRNRITGKTLYCQLLQRDQYSRVVSNVVVKRSFAPGSLLANSLAIEMLRAGWATVYEQARAQYGPEGKEEFLRVEQEAKNARRGMWQKGLTGETPAEYKRRYAQLESGKATAAAEATPSSEPETRRGRFSRMWRS